MSTIAERLTAIRAGLPAGVELVAVSKFHPVEALAEAYEAGQRIFGESRVQELCAKIGALPADIQWHFIGHLQTNKVRQLVSTGRVALIESVDSERLLRAIDAESKRAGVVSRVLMQVHVAREETKFGFTPAELEDFFARGAFRSLEATHLCGVMGMASNTDDEARIAADFEAIAEARRRALGLAPDLRGFDIVSMGMSHDYPAAIAAGSTHVRIGTAIFGDRI
ncbi:MAG: YggS family pyridoxal phosphate-dependent enzyme [Muribaculaceae bacterium]|nr:YggS family pyridoxal phosphate-dependent enzyme [Muribaculaceae bacterium]